MLLSMIHEGARMNLPIKLPRMQGMEQWAQTQPSAL